MSTASHVPETSRLDGQRERADEARETLRRIGVKRLAVDAFRRFRYGDGFSSARAMAYQFVLSLLPLTIAFIGLSSTLPAKGMGEVLHRGLLALNPGSSQDAIKQAVNQGTSEGSGGGGRLALVIGLLAALGALVIWMGQVQRSMNRIYGIQRDLSALDGLKSAAVLVPSAGLPALVGFLVILAGGSLISAAHQVYGWSGGVVTALSVLRWPVGAALALAAITVLFRRGPRRRQPGRSWLALGAAVALTFWLVFSVLLVLYVEVSSGFGKVYGPLTGIVALLIWSQLTAVALLLGISVCAQLEAARAGVPSPVAEDPEERDGARRSGVVVLEPESTSS